MSVRAEVTVPVPVERAFAVFTDGFATWWPAEYTWSQDVLQTIGIEPVEGGPCFEIGPDGFRCDWGRVLAWEPRERLVFSWQIGPDRVPVPDAAKATEVEVRFTGAGQSGTRVELEHRGFERHGDAGSGYAAGMGSEHGWPYILGRYAQAAS
jgi:uncharacterized protein YndB with AHSA1/START domain